MNEKYVLSSQCLSTLYFQFFYNMTHQMHLIGTYICMLIVGLTAGCQSKAALLETRFLNHAMNYSFICLCIYVSMYACMYIFFGMYVCMYGFVHV